MKIIPSFLISVATVLSACTAAPEISQNSIPIWGDQGNGEYAAQIYDKLDAPGYDTNEKYSQGSWAPTIRYHDGKFYMFVFSPEEGLWMSCAEYDTEPSSFHFEYSHDGKSYTQFGESFSPDFGFWKGASPALFCYSTSDETGVATFDDFVVEYL